ncbi:hypothetical protein HRR80_002132 [Exophiala dermatitidis]|uniref:Uncharacterized protein n=2 Tax=Exophiala dermatitidis TaxID=5970 RepID=H6BP84_EXODN|nr:uncharacterized protein HMPREF1120_01728 [Exophiala dermatitidis NIH/UT8656]KAJ4543221.1 hypothetical protein HRR77_005478 [Exophiala dermatitidis]EHY53539.1 hypothetical protein HMPREF1120_01728 [Exophiala dermatitidis NIH/UT8656]KAJ4543720.1 hypothetical protein HRR76_001786 [Exophiala dermatitidis]KAJ4575186.1 hypothetical protein HRR79_002116 [Exophiala dermatitidis]KAJ4587745.1 hypothetical protein HRR82_001544 [Exophiala dermatitidis]
MWRRNNNTNNTNTSMEPVLGYHAYPEQTMDERYLETIPEVESLYSRRSSVATNLPELPFRAVPPMTDEDYEYAHEPLSSTNTTFYTHQPSSVSLHARSGSGSGSGQQPNVSPISTPGSFHAHNGSDASLVSPIDSSFPSSSQHEKPARSQIPRRLPLKSPEEVPKKWTLQKTDGETRWDEYSGEPSQAGKPPSVRPGALPPVEHQYPQLKERTRQILAGLKDREAVKRTTRETATSVAEPDPLDNPGQQRPPWKGASGRHAIVEPVKNTPSARTRPLALPERRRKAEPEGVAREVEAPGRKTPDQSQPTPMSPIDAVSVAASRLPSIKPTPSEESIRPVVPLKVRNTPRAASASTQSPRPLDSPFQSPSSSAPPVRDTIPSPAPSTVLVEGADSPTLGSGPVPAPAPLGYAAPERTSSAESLETVVRDQPQPQSQRQQAPPHTFQREADTTSSWATYTTSSNGEYSSSVLDIPSSPPIPRAQFTSSPDRFDTDSSVGVPVPEPIILRKRVAANNSAANTGSRPGYYDGDRNHYDNDNNYNNRSLSPFFVASGRKSSSNILTRKAVGDGNSVKTDSKPRAVSLMTHLSSADKSLPPTPMELEAADKASSLQARLEDLSRRKRNMNKIISELRESLKKNAIVYDARKRKEVDKMIVNLGLELQDITNEEHETALRLHRVQKRRDKEDFYEQPTGLWIKRVTT